MSKSIGQPLSKQLYLTNALWVMLSTFSRPSSSLFILSARVKMPPKKKRKAESTGEKVNKKSKQGKIQLCGHIGYNHVYTILIWYDRLSLQTERSDWIQLKDCLTVSSVPIQYSVSLFNSEVLCSGEGNFRGADDYLTVVRM